MEFVFCLFDRFIALQVGPWDQSCSYRKAYLLPGRVVLLCLGVVHFLEPWGGGGEVEIRIAVASSVGLMMKRRPVVHIWPSVMWLRATVELLDC
jgi:hypothetical protein